MFHEVKQPGHYHSIVFCRRKVPDVDLVHCPVGEESVYHSAKGQRLASFSACWDHRKLSVLVPAAEGKRIQPYSNKVRQPDV